MWSKSCGVEPSEGAGGMAGMATAIPILVDLCSKAPPGTNLVFGDCPTNILLPAPPLIYLHITQSILVFFTLGNLWLTEGT